MSGSRGDGKARRATPPLPRAVILLGVVSFLNDLSGEMITPILPLFLVGGLAAPVAVVGLVEGAADSAASLLKVWAGHRSDVLQRRKRFMVAGYGAAALAKPLLAAAALWPHVLGARLLDRAGKGVRGAPRDAAIADVSDPAHVGRSFGFHRAMDTAGALGGAALALGILLWLEGSGTVELGAFRLIFLVASVPTAIAVVLLIAGFREERAASGGGERPPGLLRSVRELPGPVRAFLAVSGLFAVGNITIGLFVLRAAELAGSATLALAIYIAFNAVATVVSFPAGVLADRHGRRVLVRASFALFAAAAATFALADSLALAVAGFLLYGVYFAVWEASSRAYISEICPRERRATALGAHGTIVGLLTLPGSFVAALLWDVAGAPFAFALAAAIGLAAFVALTGVRHPAPAAG